MASSELVYILELIAEAVAWILRRTLDLICCVLYLSSMVTPWRLVEELFNPSRFSEGYDEFYSYCILSFLLAVLDCFAVPLGLLSVLSPWRWSSLYVACKDYWRREEDTYMWDLRCSLFMSGLYSIVDFLCLPFGIVSVLLLTRAWVVCRELTILIPLIMKIGEDTTTSELRGHEMNLNWTFFTQFWMSLMDSFVLILCLPPVICSVHLWQSWSEGIPRLLSGSQNELNSNEYDTRLDGYEAVYEGLRIFLIRKAAQMVIDIFALPFAACAMLSPIRNRNFRKACVACGATWCVCTSGDTTETAETLSVENAAECAERGGGEGIDYMSNFPITEHRPEPTDIEFYYNMKLRNECFYYGALAVTDLLLLPFLVPLCLTWYRFQPVKEKLLSDEPWGCAQIFIISYQAMLLTIDLFLLPIIGILFLTRVRWPPVRAKYEDDDLCSDKSFKTFGTILTSFLCLILDVLVCPFALIVLLTQYRSLSLWKIFNRSDIFNGTFGYAAKYHVAALIQCCVILHDIFFLFPVFMLCMLFGYRSSFLLRLPGSGASQRYIEALSGEGVSTVDLSAALTDAMFVGFDWRRHMWQEFFMIICDMFTIMLPSSILFLTMWRAPALLRDFSTARKVYGRSVLSSGAMITSTERSARKAFYSELRSYSVRQLLRLILDIICLAPMFIVIITLYRLPEVILQLYSKFREQEALVLQLPVDDSTDVNGINAEGRVPLLTVSKVTIEFPERGGPRMSIRATRNAHASTPPSAVEELSSLKFATMSPISKVHIIGNDLWTSVGDAFGSTVVALGKAMLPLSLLHGTDTNLADISTPGELAQGESPGEIQFWVQFNFGRVKRRSIVKKLQRLYSDSVPVVIQFEVEIAGDLGPQKSILCSVAPTVSELWRAAEAGSSELPYCALDISGERRLQQTDEFQKLTPAVDHFVPVVLFAVGQIFLDIFYIVLCLLIALLPWRLCKLVYLLFHSKDVHSLSIAKHVMTLKVEADRNLQTYRKALALILNELAKDVSIESRRDIDISTPHISRLEQFTLLKYSAIYERISKLLKAESDQDDSLDQLSALLSQLARTQRDRLMLLGLKTSLHSHFNLNSFGEIIHESAVEVVRMRDKSSWKKVNDIDLKINQEYEILNRRPRESGEKMAIKYLVSRPLAESRKIIMDCFLDVVRDVGAFLLFIVLILSVTQLPEFVSDLYKYRNSGSHTIREVIIRHVQKSADRLRRLLILFGYVLCVIILVVGLPAFIEKLPRCNSLDDAIELSRKTVKSSLSYIVETLSLFVIWRTYRLTVVAVLYALFVPAACISEGLPCVNRETSRKPKFFCSLLVWFCVLGLSIATAVVSESSDYVRDIRIAVIFLMSASCLMVMFSSGVVRARREAIFHDGDARVDPLTYFKPFFPSWSNVWALLVGPLEAVELSSVVLFYFWVPPADYANTNSTIREYASKLLLWESTAESASHAPRTSVIVAVSLLLGWMVISSFPLAYGGNNKERRLKIFKMQFSAAFNFFSVLLSQLIFVWLVFTLLMPSTCVSSSDGPIMASSLADPVDCGDGGYATWAFRLSLPLLVYFYFTCTMLHSNADMVELMNDPHSAPQDAGSTVYGELEGSINVAHIVSYDQFYSRLLQALQVVVCVTCSTGLESANKNVPLAIVVAACFIMAVVPPIFLRYSCKLAPVVGIRSVGALLACWTGIVCVLNTNSDSVPWEDSTVLYSGWLIITGAGAVVISLTEYLRHKKWAETLQQNNLSNLVESLSTIVERVVKENMFVETSMITSDQEAVRVTIKKIRTANSFTAIREVMLELERIILAERLKGSFLSNRATWRQRLSCWNFTGPHSISLLRNLVAQLNDGLHEDNPLAIVSRNVLSITLKRKCPEEIAWEIYSFLFDSTNVRRVLDGVLKSLEYVNVGTCLSPHLYGGGFTSTDVFWKAFNTVNRHRNEMMKIVINDNSLYGKSVSTALPRSQPPHAASGQVGASEEEQAQILMDRSLALQLSAASGDPEESF